MENTHRSPETTTPRFRFGVAKFGSRRHSAWTIAAPGGIILAAAVGALTTAVTGGLQDGRLTWGWTFLIFSLCALPFTIALVWVAIVDRDTVPGASRTPEDNVENTWFSKAAETTMILTFPAAGLGAGFTTTVHTELLAVSLTLLGVCLFMALTFAIAYTWEKRH